MVNIGVMVGAPIAVAVLIAAALGGATLAIRSFVAEQAYETCVARQAPEGDGVHGSTDHAHCPDPVAAPRETSTSRSDSDTTGLATLPRSSDSTLVRLLPATTSKSASSA